MPQLSKSRTMTATCARLAASATSVKTLRKASVDEPLVGGGGGAGALVADEAARESMDDGMGASMARGVGKCLIQTLLALSSGCAGTRLRAASP